MRYRIDRTPGILRVPKPIWDAFRSALLTQRPEGAEGLGFFFSKKSCSQCGPTTYVPTEWVVPARDCYSWQTAAGLEISQEYHIRLIKKHLLPGLDVVHIHSHPGSAFPHFSSTDDHYEKRYITFLNRYRPGSRLISGVFDEGINHGRFRLWCDSESRPTDIDFNTNWFTTKGSEPTNAAPEVQIGRAHV